MGILIGCEHLGHEWPGKPVLDDVTIGVNEGDRIGIVGKNGDGKSTLLQLIAHTLEPDHGAVTWRGGITVGMLGQSDALDDDQSVGHEVVGDVPEYEWASNPETRRIIAELIGDVDWNAKVGTLSGGQRRRVDLTRLLIGTYDVLLLDEPTNHLDMGAITWLAGHLRHRWQRGSGAMLVITHDRWFLDETCESMWEVHDRLVEPFEGGYSAYIQQRAERERMAQASEERRQNILRKELAWLSRGAQARSSKPKFRIEAARALVADVPPMRNPLELKRLAVSRLGKQVFELKGATVCYDGHVVLDHLDWLIGPGDRYGILGENGAGKTTLLRLLDGKLAPTSGRVKMGKSVKLGILSQHIDLLADKLDWRVRELLGTYKRSYVIGGKEYTPTKLLESLGFDKRELDTPIADLSGGQSRRLALMCVLLDEPNVLILDEPGNDLDTDMLAVMEDLLDTWPGTLIVVSHDRYLLERVTDQQFALIGGKVRHLPGGVDDYLDMIEKAKTAAPAGVSASQKEPAGSGVTATADDAPKLSGKEFRETSKRISAIERKLAKLEEQKTALEADMAAHDPSDYEGLNKLNGQLQAVSDESGALEAEWMELSEKLE